MSVPDAKWTLNINAEQAKADTLAAIRAGVAEVFELDIKPDAVENSPYLTGHNRRMIDEDVELVAGRVQARLYSQSGYGGYIELGTKKMKARPYLWPAFNKFVSKLKEVIGTKVRAIKPGMFIGPRQKG